MLKDIWRIEPVSRIELVDETKLTSGTITNLTLDLLKAGLLKETELTTGSVGRRRVMLRLNEMSFKIIGIDIGRSSYEVVTTNLIGQILDSQEVLIDRDTDPLQVLEGVAAIVRKSMSQISEQNDKLLGIGLSIPGPMNLKEGVLLVPPNFPHWEHFEIRKELESRLGRRIVMNDDARTSALAERWFGHSRKLKEDSFVYITMGHGIGGGVVSNGEIILGNNGLYGQVGHITVVPGGELCECGNRGCWETVGSIPGILRRWNPENKNSTIEDFFKAVQAKDPSAERCLEWTLQMMESTLTTLFNVYDPALIIIGGKLYPYLESYVPRIRHHVQASVYPSARSHVIIESASFGTSQSAVGAASLVFGELVERPLDVLDEVNMANE
ncbi:ROK family protein [Cohnella cellulosilytica]|uniref:ROK family protein n=1 Tax=Cohnella cellulosilytica TaxID=986710 RepID=UPI003671B679